jgi:23S rRNA pseudouridine1911/1915/1917 synthase
VTAFQVVARFGPGLQGRPPPAAAHVACRLETGRTHQIRVHLAHIGASLIGDPVYGATRSARVLDDVLGGCVIARQALHAATLSFDHPETGRRLSFETPWPSDIERLYAALQAL